MHFKAQVAKFCVKNIILILNVCNSTLVCQQLLHQPHTGYMKTSSPTTVKHQFQSLINISYEIVQKVSEDIYVYYNLFPPYKPSENGLTPIYT